MMNSMILMKALIKPKLIQQLESVDHKIIEDMMNIKVHFIKETNKMKLQKIKSNFKNLFINKTHEA